MGNCSLKGAAMVGAVHGPIRIMSDSGQILEFNTPTLVQDVVRLHPGYGVFLKGYLSSPLSGHLQLFSSEMYYLLPTKEEKEKEKGMVVLNEVTTKSEKSDEEVVSPRLSLGQKSGGMSMGNGMWKVKLVIDKKQLEEILVEQVNIGALIERMRAVATSECVTPRPRSKMYWGAVGRRPSVSSVLKLSPGEFKQC